MTLGEAGLELGIGAQVLEAYHKRKWMTISSKTPIRVTKGVEGVENLYNWEIDKHYIEQILSISMTLT
jgi:hypothetical protein